MDTFCPSESRSGLTRETPMVTANYPKEAYLRTKKQEMQDANKDLARRDNKYTVS